MLTLAPFTAPPVVGANVTVKTADWPADRIVPFEIPLALNPVPITVTPEIVTLEFPLLETVVINELLLPSITFPNTKLEGFAPTDSVVACPVPDISIISGEGAPLVVNAIEPFTVPADNGSNVASNVALAPGPIVVDVLSPTSLKPAPETPMCENVSVELPVFVNRIGCEFVFPSTTVPKPTLDGLAEICAAPDDGLTVSARVAVPVPALFVALNPTPKVPDAVGVPEIVPLDALIDKPVGRPVAP
jgi:hypothetical protein